MEMPKPTRDHERLHQLVGEWTGDEVLHPSPFSPEKRTAVGRFSSRMAVDGMFLLSDYEEERDGEIVFRGHCVYGFDPNSGKYTMFWFDSMGLSPSETFGEWDGDTLTYESRGEHGSARYVYQVEGPDAFAFTIFNSADGDTWVPLMEGRYTRVA